MEDVSRSGLIPSLQTPNYKQCKEQVKLVAFLACVNGEESESKLLQLVIRAVFITARAYLTLYMPLGAYGLITNFHFFFFYLFIITTGSTSVKRSPGAQRGRVPFFCTLAPCLRGGEESESVFYTLWP